jgi:hypothetical protein
VFSIVGKNIFAFLVFAPKNDSIPGTDLNVVYEYKYDLIRVTRGCNKSKNYC